MIMSLMAFDRLTIDNNSGLFIFEILTILIFDSSPINNKLSLIATAQALVHSIVYARLSSLGVMRLKIFTPSSCAATATILPSVSKFSKI